MMKPRTLVITSVVLVACILAIATMATPMISGFFWALAGLTVVGAVVASLVKFNTTRDSYDLNELLRVHEQAELAEIDVPGFPEEEEAEEILCPGCGQTYRVRLPICPHCRTIH